MKHRPTTSAEIRQAYLDYFKAQGHAIVASSSLLPSSPNLLFTNSGMNQFVPHFLGERPAAHPRIADTQKCIRAGGKHNDLDDVGFDGYHHTFFEMLGNWSFGDYFKKEAIHWAWELLTKIWGFPKNRLYATVYKPSAGDPADFDQEAYDLWSEVFIKEGMDPTVHICYGNKKDNFWMMGETGPCGPCTEIHMDLTPEGDSAGLLVNADSPWCIELWNLVFIQFNAEANGTFIPLPAQHVDTGMGFERIAGILATTKCFTDYSKPTSNYNSDLFTDIFAYITRMSGAQYTGTLPSTKDRKALSAQEYQDCTFRVLADHIRTLSFSIADGILPGSEGRNYVLRRILRRAVLFGKRLGLKPGFLAALVDPLVEKLAPIFPELRAQERIIKKVLENEEMSFERTLDRGLQHIENYFKESASTLSLSGLQAFTLYDTYGFPLDLTEIMAQERGFAVDKAGFEVEMEKQRERARAAQNKTVIKLAESSATATTFVGYDRANQSEYSTTALGLESITKNGQNTTYLIAEATPFYAEMGGQVGDTGTVLIGHEVFQITDTLKDSSGRFLHALDRAPDNNPAGASIRLAVDIHRRRAIERHHSGVHILNFALRKVLGLHVAQAGSYVCPDYFRFDFSHFEALKPEEIAKIEAIVQEHILENQAVKWFETPFDQKPADVLAFFGDKYGSYVRVVDIGGFSKELCGGTHVEATGEIAGFKIVSETAIAAGTRRIEAVCGRAAFNRMAEDSQILRNLSSLLSCTKSELDLRTSHLLAERSSLEKKLRGFEQKALAHLAEDLAKKAILKNDLHWVVQSITLAQAEDLKSLALQVSKILGPSVVALGARFGENASIVAACSAQAIAQGHNAGTMIKTAGALLGGKGGGRPDFAMGGGKDSHQLEFALSKILL